MTKKTIPFIPGDGIGLEIMDATRRIVDAAVETASGGSQQIEWLQVEAGEQAFQSGGDYLPDATLDTIQKYQIAIKGPLTTPVGGGFRSLNVALRQQMDLYVCQRPVRWTEGLPSPHRSPQGIDLVIFRENTEDIYTGIEYEAGTPAHLNFMQAYQMHVQKDYEQIPQPAECGIGIKPISRNNSQRLVRAAIQWAISNKRKRVTLVHKGNIMKYTEGAFMRWGYDEAEDHFGSQVFTQRKFQALIDTIGEDQAKREKKNALASGKIWVDDLIADVVFEKLITYPQQFDVIATTNLNGDYLSDAAAALAGGVGISPGANINYNTRTALFEANHGSADAMAGLDMANPSSLILSAVMMLHFIGWDDAADRVESALATVIRHKQVTFDLAAQIAGATTLGTKAFADRIIATIRTEAS
jgi:isocitrate dehydrogenase